MKKFVVFDEDGGWAAQVEAESLESALLFVCEDSKGDFNWKNGDSLKVGEIVFDGTICSSVVSNKVELESVEEEEVETSNGFDWTCIVTVPLFPVGTILRAKVDSPLGSHLQSGDLVVVTTLNERGDCSARKLTSPDGFQFFYGTTYSVSAFRSVWEVVYVPVEEAVTDTREILEALPAGTILEAQVDFPICISGMCKGDVGIVENDYKIQLLQGKGAGDFRWYGDKNDSMEKFNERWKIIYTPPE